MLTPTELFPVFCNEQLKDLPHLCLGLSSGTAVIDAVICEPLLAPDIHLVLQP